MPWSLQKVNAKRKKRGGEVVEKTVLDFKSLFLPNEIRILLRFWFVKPTTAIKGNLGTNGKFLIWTAY